MSREPRTRSDCVKSPQFSLSEDIPSSVSICGFNNVSKVNGSNCRSLATAGMMRSITSLPSSVSSHGLLLKDLVGGAGTAYLGSAFVGCWILAKQNPRWISTMEPSDRQMQ